MYVALLSLLSLQFTWIPASGPVSCFFVVSLVKMIVENWLPPHSPLASDVINITMNLVSYPSVW